MQTIYPFGFGDLDTVQGNIIITIIVLIIVPAVSLTN